LNKIWKQFRPIIEPIWNRPLFCSSNVVNAKVSGAPHNLLEGLHAALLSRLLLKLCIGLPLIESH